MDRVALSERLADRYLDPTRGSVLPLNSALCHLMAAQGLRRGSVIGVSGAAGASSLLLALLAPPLREGSWGAVVGIPELGIEAAAGLGVPLERLVLVPRPGRVWPDVVAALVDAFDLVVLRRPPYCTPALARRLVARGRERGCVLVIASPASLDRREAGPGSWPESIEVAFEIEPLEWQGLGDGCGTLRRREVTVSTSGRRVVNGHRMRLLLPDVGGMVALSDAPSLVVPDHERTASAG